jgi:hypothetical protein
MGSLSEVLSVQEVSLLWGKNRNSVRYHMDRGNFKWRYTETGRIMVERASVEALWGPSLRESDEF